MTPSTAPATTVLLTPRRASLREAADNTVEVLLRVQAPPAPQRVGTERPPLALALVIDRSGSMQGRPLDEARRCAEAVLAHLRPTDSVALVQFDQSVQRLWPAMPVGDGSAQRAVLAGIQAGGNTHLHGGWREGADALGDVPGEGLKRVILLSDGQANAGLTDPRAIASHCATSSARGITTSTYGLGCSFNEDLMTAMARDGGGNAYYGETAEDLMAPFLEELELLDQLCLRDLRLTVQTPDGVACERVNDGPAGDRGWRLTDLAWGAEAWAVLRLRVPAAVLPARGGALPLLQVSISASALDGQAVRLERTALALRVQSGAEHDALADDELTVRRLTELAAAQALDRMRAFAADGDWPLVERQLAEAHRQFAGNPWVSALLSTMDTLAASRSREGFGKEAKYSAGKLRDRLAAREEQLSLAEGLDDSRVPAHLRRKVAQGRGQR